MDHRPPSIFKQKSDCGWKHSQLEMFSLPENEMTKESIALLLVGHLPAVAGARTEGAKYT